MITPRHANFFSQPPFAYPQPSSLPRGSPFSPPISMNKSLANDNEGLLHPAFLPPCEHGGTNGDMHAHAFDLLSLSNGKVPHSIPPAGPFPTSTLPVIPASVPTHPTSVLSATRPPTAPIPNGSTLGLGQRARRMSSSTTGVLGRGKLGLTGEGLQVGSVGKDGRPNLLNATSYSGPTPVPNRRPVPALGSSPQPQLFDFAKTDRRPSASRPTAPPLSERSVSASAAVPASLPTRTNLLSQRLPSSNVMELDMEFDGDEDDDGEIEGGSGRSGSQELDLDMDMDEEGGAGGGEGKDWKKLALGTGSGGVKGRRKGMVFKCESCAKEYRHPSCLVKHRWEHSPHWKEPTQLSMSKHQQVQMLEAAAILAHLQPTQGRALPNDKSLWPAMLSPPGGEHAQLRRASQSGPRDLSTVRSPASIAAPLTPSSLREVSGLALSMGQPRKTSPGSDSTTSSNGATSDPYVPSSRPVGIQNTHHASMSPGPQSVGSLPNELAGLHFHTGTSYNHRSSFNNNHSVSPIPNRGCLPGMSYKAGMIGGGMFGSSGMRPGSLSLSREVPNSSVRSGAGGGEEEEEDEEGRRGKSSSEEAEEKRKLKEGEEEWGMAMEMEL